MFADSIDEVGEMCLKEVIDPTKEVVGYLAKLYPRLCENLRVVSY